MLRSHRARKWVGWLRPPRKHSMPIFAHRCVPRFSSFPWGENCCRGKSAHTSWRTAKGELGTFVILRSITKSRERIVVSFPLPLLFSNIDGSRVWKAYDTYSRRSLFTHAYVSSLLLSACTEGGGRETGPRIPRNILLAHRDIRVESFGWNPRHLKDFNSGLSRRAYNRRCNPAIIRYPGKEGDGNNRDERANASTHQL